jgi:L-fuculose-phosphate aldolase
MRIGKLSVSNAKIVKNNPDVSLYKDKLAGFMRRLYRLKLTTTLGGNISMRMTDGNILITPSGTDKGEIQGDDIGVMNLKGKIIGQKFTPSIETQMHLELYKIRPDINAVIHAHPVTACAFSATSAGINYKLIVESYVILGRISYARYHPMGTIELADEVADAAKDANCIIMKNHGALTVGESLLQAFDRMEVLENAAQMTLINGMDLKKFYRPLNKTQIKNIDNTQAHSKVY